MYICLNIHIKALFLFAVTLSPVDNLSKQSGPRSSPTKSLQTICRSDGIPDTDPCPERFIF